MSLALLTGMVLGVGAGYLWGRSDQRKVSQGRTKKGLVLSDKLMRK